MTVGMGAYARSRVTVVERIRAERLVAILRRIADPDGTVDALVRGGIRVVEITLDSDDAAATIRRLRARGDVTVIAGTVRRAAQAVMAVEAGAEACVSPALFPDVVECCSALGVPAIPGALTPTEVELAWSLGVPLVKLFPGSAVGPGYVRELRAPLADIPLMVTGGIDASNARAFLDAGAVAVGAGSSLTRAADVEAEARRLVAGVLDV
jgi:2-dehydro-3-deoxyphosphogluconate aldolase / (4S)-4-hydroxy-2-oxoglutarate aldolase